MFSRNSELLLLQLVHFALVVGWPLLAIAALIALRRSGLSGLMLLGWTVLVIAIPILGALAFLIVRSSAVPLVLTPSQEAIEHADGSGG